MDSAGQRQQHKTALYFVLIFFFKLSDFRFFGWVGFVSAASRSSEGLHFFSGVYDDSLCCQCGFQAVKQCVLSQFPASVELQEMGRPVPAQG